MICQIEADVIVLSLHLIVTDFTRQSADFVLSLKAGKIRRCNQVQALLQITWRTLKPVRETKAIHRQWSAACALTMHARLLKPPSMQTQYIHSAFFPSVLCSADAHTGIGKAIVSNCNAQDFDYTLALKAQHCKRTIAQRALSSRRCNFSPFLMREHIKR